MPEAGIEGRNKYLHPQFVWHVITCPCLWHLLKAHRSTVCLRAVLGKLRIVMHTPEMLPEVGSAWRLLMDKICEVNTEGAMWHSSLPYIVMKKIMLDYLDIAHYNEVIMGAIASQITSLTIVYSTDYSDAHQRKHQSSASPAFVPGIHRGPVNSPHKWPVTRKMFPFDDVIMDVTNDIKNSKWEF